MTWFHAIQSILFLLTCVFVIVLIRATHKEDIVRQALYSCLAYLCIAGMLMMVPQIPSWQNKPELPTSVAFFKAVTLILSIMFVIVSVSSFIRYLNLKKPAKLPQKML